MRSSRSWCWHWDGRCLRARAVAASGASMLRGGAFKPRTSPYAFRGLGAPGLELLAAARAETGLPVVTEVMDTRDVELVSKWADMLQIGARNMQNYALLAEVGRSRKPVLLKRSMSGTISELLFAAEHILVGDKHAIEKHIGEPFVAIQARGPAHAHAFSVQRHEKIRQPRVRGHIGIRAKRPKDLVAKRAARGPRLLPVQAKTTVHTRRVAAQRSQVAARFGLRPTLCPQTLRSRDRLEASGLLGSGDTR